MAAVTAAAVLEVARRELGTKESPPGSNRQRYGAAYGWNGVAWCAQWVWYVLTKAGCGPLIPKTASTVVMADWYRKRGQWHTRDPRPGDLVFFKFAGNNNPVNHVGIVEAVEAGGTLICIEGNTAGTAAGDQRNGGMVARKRRLANVVGFARPTYPPAAVSAAPEQPPSPAADLPVKDADMLDNIPVRGSGTFRRILPVGRASAVIARAWVSLVADGPGGATAHVYFQSDGGGINDRPLEAIYRDGWSSRAWAEAPDGTTQINVRYDAPDGAVIALEGQPR